MSRPKKFLHRLAETVSIAVVAVTAMAASQGDKSNKAQTANDAKWMDAHLASGYVEGTSFGTWIPKAPKTPLIRPSRRNRVPDHLLSTR